MYNTAAEANDIKTYASRTRRESSDPPPIPEIASSQQSLAEIGNGTILTFSFLIWACGEEERVRMCQWQRENVEEESRDAHLLLRREVVDNVEELADLLRGLALDHVRDCLASNIAIIDKLVKKRDNKKA